MTFLLGIFVLIVVPLLIIGIGSLLLWLGVKVACIALGG